MNATKEQLIRRVRDFGQSDEAHLNHLKEVMELSMTVEDFTRVRDSYHNLSGQNPTVEDLKLLDLWMAQNRVSDQWICVRELQTQDEETVKSQKSLVNATKTVFGVYSQVPRSLYDLSIVSEKLILSVGSNIKRKQGPVVLTSIHAKDVHPAMPVKARIDQTFEIPGTDYLLDKVSPDPAYRGPAIRAGHRLVCLWPGEGMSASELYRTVSSCGKGVLDKYSRYLSSGGQSLDAVIDICENSRGLECHFLKMDDFLNCFATPQRDCFLLTLPAKKCDMFLKQLEQAGIRGLWIGTFNGSGKITDLFEEGCLDLPMTVIRNLFGKTGHAVTVPAISGELPELVLPDETSCVLTGSDPFLRGAVSGVLALTKRFGRGHEDAHILIPLNGTDTDALSESYSLFLGTFRASMELVIRDMQIHFVPGLDRLTVFFPGYAQNTDVSDSETYFVSVKMNAKGLPDFEDIRQMRLALSDKKITAVRPLIGDLAEQLAQLGFEPLSEDETASGFALLFDAQEALPAPCLKLEKTQAPQPDLPEVEEDEVAESATAEADPDVS
ncbi:MAG: hypothetical protein J6023_05910 [Clostridia bacterium]|nr:hypothetical protein [Clostridia bacterium]